MAKPRILVVDDEPRFLSNMVRLLTGKGLDVSGASSGEAALDMASKAMSGEGDERPFDIILLDMKLPGLDGRATLAALQEKKCDAEVIVLTGHAAVDEAVDILNQGAFDYLLKPCRTETLMRMLELACEKRGLRLE